MQKRNLIFTLNVAIIEITLLILSSFAIAFILDSSLVSDLLV